LRAAGFGAGAAIAGFGAGVAAAGFGAACLRAAGLGAAFGTAGFTATAVGSRLGAPAGFAADVLRAAGLPAGDLAADLAVVVARALRAGLFAAFPLGAGFAAVFLAGFFAADFFAVFFAGANILSLVSFFAFVSLAAFFIFFAMIVLRSLRRDFRYSPGRLNFDVLRLHGTSGIHALGLAAPPDCRIPLSALGAGPPVAQSINSIGCTTGILVPAAIWMMQPIFPTAINSGSVFSI